MLAETGLYALILALFAACFGGVLPLIGGRHKAVSWMAVSRSAALAQAGLVAVAFAVLTVAFATSDFSLRIVAENSHTDKPLLYKIAAVWASHEGSLLLWTLILVGYGAVFAIGSRALPARTRAVAAAALALIGATFLAYLIFVANPFARLSPAPLDGAGLNPLLQDPGLVYHPPLLYLGYVGLAPVFALGLAALIDGRLDGPLAAALRRWTLVAWSLLTLGIGLGGWWSYMTLGWGGWWAWDPVENASLMPWLVATALLHVAPAVERRRALKAWAVFLALTAFALTLLGAFVVRSGALSSLHAFASDPTRGLAVLAILAAVVGGGFLVFALRAGRLRDEGVFAPLSRESGLLFASILLTVAAATLLIGTLYPLLAESLGGGALSVGPPYFNLVFSVLAVPTVALMAAGPLLAERRDRVAALARLRLPSIVGICGSLIVAGADKALPTVVVTGLAVFAGLALARTRGSRAMTIAHAGIVALLVGLAGQAWQSETTATLHAGEGTWLAGREIRLAGATQAVVGADAVLRAQLTVLRQGRTVGTLTPEQRFFVHPPVAKAVPAVRIGPFATLYAVLAAGDGQGGYTIHLLHQPLQIAIFLGLALIAVGGFVGLARRSTPAAPEAACAPPAQGAFLRILPLVGLAVLAVFLGSRLIQTGPETEPASALVGAPVPAFVLPALFQGDADLKTADLKGKTTVVNFFASWCAPCRAEAPALQALAQSGVAVYGIAYKDTPQNARAALTSLGNPYATVAQDTTGRTALDFGLTGVPETFVVDRGGTVRWHHAGPLTEAMVRDQILPLVRRLP